MCIYIYINAAEIAVFHGSIEGLKPTPPGLAVALQGTLGASCGALPHRERRQCWRITGRQKSKVVQFHLLRA